VSGVSANTATGTIATAEAGAPCIGRFAPSPTGALHLGSLAAATASYLDARARQGSWLLRIEDLDTPRVVAGAAAQMLGTLAALGFHWDGEVTWQSRRLAHYAAALARLQALGHTYECSCSRREWGSGDDAGGYPGTCRSGPTRPGPTAVRFRADLNDAGPFMDALQGQQSAATCTPGDPVIRRRDGLYAYQLAVVVDDASTGVTHVVRGADLLASTAWQRALQQALGLPTPHYAHIPLVTHAGGAKLSKSRHAIAIDAGGGASLIHEVLNLLRQQPPAELRRAPLPELWQWAIAHWQPERLRLVPWLASSARLV
jgi:glutamyl-Q tRNA(Asp) synthetase